VSLSGHLSKVSNVHVLAKHVDTYIAWGVRMHNKISLIDISTCSWRCSLHVL